MTTESAAPNAPSKPKRPSRAEVLLVNTDRWGDRWVTNKCWMLNLEAAKSTGRLPTEIGVWQGGKPCAEPFYLDRPLPKIDKALRMVTRVRDYVTLEPVLDADGLHLLETGWAGQNRAIGLWRRSDGELVRIDRAFANAVLKRLPKNVVLIQRRTKDPDSYWSGHVTGPIAVLLNRRIVGEIMPLAVPAQYRTQRWEERDAA